MRDYLKGKNPQLLERMQDRKDLSAEDEKALKDAVADWKKNGSY